MAIELVTCNACGTKNASHRTVCLKCGVKLRPHQESRTGLMTGIQNFLGSLFYNKKAIICFGKEFFQAGEDSDVYFAHNLDDGQHSKAVKEVGQKGLVFSAEQKSMHSDDIGDCGECFLMHGYVIGFWNYVIGTRLPSPRARRWKISVSSGAMITSLLDGDLSRGRGLYELSEGRQILEMSGANLDPKPELIKLGDIKYVRDLRATPIYEVSYLAMYDKARRLGFDANQALKYAFIRGNVYSFASLLGLRDEILMI